jgi:hypothetical protein
MYYVMLPFSGFSLARAIYYLLKMRNQSKLDCHIPMRLPQNNGTEKRKNPRADLNRLFSMQTSDGATEGEIRNISLGGAINCCKKPLPIGRSFG